MLTVFWKRKNSSASVFLVNAMVLVLVTSIGDALTINDIDLEKVMAIYEEVNTVPVTKHALFPQPEEVYSTFNIPKHDKVSSRQKRFTRLFFPTQSLFAIDIYINLPLLAQAHVFTPLTLQSRTYFILPNITFNDFSNLKRSLTERLHFFDMAEQFFNKLGYDGRSCVLLALCERSEFHIVSDGIIGEIVTLLLEFTTASGDISYQDYEAAREFGRSAGNCQKKYSSCSLSIFSWLKDPDDIDQNIIHRH